MKRIRYQFIKEENNFKLFITNSFILNGKTIWGCIYCPTNLYKEQNFLVRMSYEPIENKKIFNTEKIAKSFIRQTLISIGINLDYEVKKKIK